jgi:hypothetical protein
MNLSGTFLNKVIRSLFFHPTGNGRKDRSWLEKVKTPSFQKVIIGIGTALILAFLLSPSFQFRIKEYTVGDVATKEVKSAYDLLVEDVTSTQEKRLEAERWVFSVYDYDPAVLADTENRVRSLVRSLSVQQELEKGPGQGPPLENDLDSSLRSYLSQKEWQILEKENSNPSLGEAILKLLSPPLTRGVVPDKDLLDADAEKGILIRNIQTREEKRVRSPLNLLDLKEARAKLRGQANLLSPPLKKESAQVALKIIGHLLGPNLTFNKDETEARKAEARETVSPVYFQVKRGEIILRSGDRVREDHLAKINALRKAQEKSNALSILIGLILLVSVALVSLYEFSSKNIRKFSLSQKDLLLLATTMLATMALLRLFQLIADILGGAFLSIPSSSYDFLFPIVTGAMLVRIVINSEVAIVYAILTSYFASSLMGNQLFLFIFTFIGSILGAHKVAQCEQRSIVIKAGLAVGGVNAVMILSYHLMSGSPFRMGLFSGLIMGFLGGVFASVLVLGLTPIIESLFSYTTDIKLLELANMDNPMIKDLILQAPGTYHHSVIVGSLVEAGAKSVSANPLLSRVSAFYHDIGKLKKPLYFIENAGGMENKHDHLTPHMSSLILLSHVKDGVELARENGLGERIANIIQQHHGTSLISYFYQKAKEQENPELESLQEEDFRYPGPKPQTKEAGIVMLADAVEAASRSLTDPTPSRIRSLVQQIISSIFLDGQLEDCELTLKDLHNIEESFTRILTGIFHQRIDYSPSASPDPIKKKPDEDRDSKSAKTVPFRLKRNKKAGSTDIGRIGSS